MEAIVAKLSALPLTQHLALGGVLVVASLGLIYNFVFAKKGNIPPYVACLPIVGGLIKFIQGPMVLMKDAYAKYGEVFTVPIAGYRITFLLGPHASPHFYKAPDTEMSQKEVYQFNVPTFGRGVVFDVDHTVRQEQFRFFAEALKGSRMRTYVGMMVQEAEAFFAKKLAGDSGVVDLHELLSELIILTASRTLMGNEIREHLFENVYKLFLDLDMGMQPISVVAPYLPIPAHRRRDKSRAELAAIFSKVINARRDKGVKEQDVLQSFIDARYKNGKGLKDDEICGMLIAVLFAGQHTSSVTSTWTGMQLLAHKSKFWGDLLKEQKQVMSEHGEELNYDILQKMDCLHFAIKEALRLHPPLIMLMRMCHKEHTVTTSSGQEYTIPKGDVVAVSPAFAHRLDHVFTNPETYDPERWGPDRKEGEMPFSFIGFGGGRHGCMGEQFAYMQVKTIWSYLLRNFDFELVSPCPEPNYDAMVVGPKGECKVKYTRRKL
mmetsp:Transcript_13108/g.15840  ORF Transcript_13108/g.15840 Transcript_13108/m.15840 type:complete len:491 (-) Transcript_13108:705-2177(-)|eukprot:CAMPEP_0197848164 /NCGR_PEP_ID=MMETSP1438-20131217/7959_1 /TAXON_ID=1461541 /ORGANISM="Pterosperma sp., Strain CCMP1384" /LENGTH=490 /DNA_ID=CAMNT_0043460303 /DNA_START=144 /DNA_END=1616 /DNA_ORIENTATION=-